ncbi:MAG: hypothetical protein KDD53_01075 [Bdellovibrionales bacterium]|nr:hypothetical protein [Bdellovibrionales bacterium]
MLDNAIKILTPPHLELPPGEYPLEVPKSMSRMISDITFESTFLTDIRQLSALTRFPEDALALVSQTPPTLPASAFFELFLPDRILEFAEQVTREVNPESFDFSVVRCALVSNGATHLNHPICTVTTFEHEGLKIVGPMIGAIANPLLRFGGHLPAEFKRAFTAELLQCLMQSGQFDALVLAFPAPWSRGNEEFSLDTVKLYSSGAFNILTSSPIGCVPFQFKLLRDGSNGAHPKNHIYFFNGPDHLLRDNRFLDIVQAVREIRQEQLDRLLADEQIRIAETQRDSIRADYIRRIFP